MNACKLDRKWRTVFLMYRNRSWNIWSCKKKKKKKNRITVTRGREGCHFCIFVLDFSAITKVPQTGGLKLQKYICAQFWRLGGPRSRCWLIWFLIRTFFLAWSQLLLHCVRIWWRDRQLWCLFHFFFFFLIRAPAPLGQGSTLIICVFSGPVMSDSFATPWTVAHQVLPLWLHLIFIIAPQAWSLKIVTLGARVSIYEF